MMIGMARIYSLIIAVFTGAGLLIALYTQHYLDAMPCAWCILQRMIFMIIFVIALIGTFISKRTVLKLIALFNFLLAAGGIATVIYQWTSAESGFICARTWIEQVVDALGLSAHLPEVFGIYATCAEAVAPFLGIPYPAWSGSLFLMVLILTGAILVRLRSQS